MNKSNLILKVSVFLAIFGFFLPSVLSVEGSSQVSINLTSELSILVTGSINFGVGRVNANATTSVLDSSIDLNFTWTNVTPTVVPTGFAAGTMAFDSSRNKMVYFGGTPDGANVLNETWEYNGTSWTKITTTNSPKQLGLANMVYDSNRNVIILFGGSDLANSFDETWEYNGSSATWTNISPATSPLARAAAGFAFVSSKNVAVLAEGAGCNGWCDDVWIYNTTTKDWLNVTPATVPSGRGFLGMAYDAFRNVVLFYGGRGASGTTNDTWEITPADWTFTKVAEAQYKLSGSGMVYDSFRKKIVLFGGYDGDGAVPSNYTADYNSDSKQWDSLTLNKSFMPRALLASAFDSNRNVVVMQGGANADVGATQIYNDTYELSSLPGAGTLNGSWFFAPQYFYVENDGTINETVNVSVDKNAATLLGGTSPSFKMKAVTAKPGSCTGTFATSYFELTTGQQTVCSLLKFDNAADTFKTAIQLTIPNDANPGEKTAVITFTAS